MPNEQGPETDSAGSVLLEIGVSSRLSRRFEALAASQPRPDPRGRWGFAGEREPISIVVMMHVRCRNFADLGAGVVCVRDGMGTGLRGPHT